MAIQTLHSTDANAYIMVFEKDGDDFIVDPQYFATPKTIDELSAIFDIKLEKLYKSLKIDIEDVNDVLDLKANLSKISELNAKISTIKDNTEKYRELEGKLEILELEVRRAGSKTGLSALAQEFYALKTDYDYFKAHIDDGDGFDDINKRIVALENFVKLYEHNEIEKRLGTAENDIIRIDEQFLSVPSRSEISTMRCQIDKLIDDVFFITKGLKILSADNAVIKPELSAKIDEYKETSIPPEALSTITNLSCELMNIKSFICGLSSILHVKPPVEVPIIDLNTVVHTTTETTTTEG